ncbi:MAG: PKD domain-containing protein, partial [Candidatus Competibacteraceae bacterium]|nr:PKD domain-containing protein [Candidatus Competibacteraceae bacterium]
NPSITNVTTANSGTYTVTVTDANSCTATASTNVTIYALPTPTANNNTPVCEGVTVSITSTPAGMASYNWTGPGGYTSSTQNPSITNPTTAESGTYTVTVTDGNGCTATASTVVTVNAMPIPTAGNNGPVCSGVDINLTSSGGASYSWSGPGGYISVAQNPVLSPTTPSMSGTYTVTVSSGAGCSATATTSVTVNALPVPVAANDGPHCEGLVLTLNSMGGVSYNWTGPGGYTSTDQSPVINPTAASQTGTYTVTVTDVNGCTATTSTDVTIYALPVPSAASSGPACQGLSINLASGGGVSYSWVGPNAFSSAMQNPVLNNVDISHAGTYTVTVTSSDGCTASTTVDVVVNPLPQPNYSAANIIGCSPVCADFSDLSVIATGAVTGWEWSANGNVFSNAQNPTQCFSTPGTYDILLTATSDQGCTSSFIINDLVTVYVNPIADFTIYPEVIISNNPTANFTNTSTANAILWNWNFGDGTFGTDENPIHLYADTGQFCITLTVQTAQGCQDTTTHCLYIFPEYKIYIPNTFTPNDDKINDFFTVGGMGIESIEMQIFNRWGESVYTTTSMLGWPGTIGSTEVIAKQDVYVYKIWVITFQGEVFEYYGHVNLLR